MRLTKGLLLAAAILFGALIGGIIPGGASDVEPAQPARAAALPFASPAGAP